MTPVKDMLDATARDGLDIARLVELLEALQDAEQAATSCASAMLAAGHDSVDAVRADLDLADLCQAAVRVLARSADDESVTRPLLDACAAAARRSHAQCSRHAHHHGHCRLCSEASQRVVDLAG